MDYKKSDIYKAAGIIIKDRKILVEKDSDKEFFISPGGKLEPGESPEEALVRELNEELKILVNINDLEEFGHYHAPASGQEHRIVHMQVYMVNKYKGKIKKGHKVEKLVWLNSKIPNDLKVGSIFEHKVIPKLTKLKLID
jgi:mutator protein MutT